jgi:hypothetical protein
MGTTSLDASFAKIGMSKVGPSRGTVTYQASARYAIPTEPDAISIFDIIPLVFDTFVVHVAFRQFFMELLQNKGGGFC